GEGNTPRTSKYVKAMPKTQSALKSAMFARLLWPFSGTCSLLIVVPARRLPRRGDQKGARPAALEGPGPQLHFLQLLAHAVHQPTLLVVHHRRTTSTRHHPPAFQSRCTSW